MACIKDYTTPAGMRVQIYDDSYATASAEEIARRRAAFNRLAREMMLGKLQKQASGAKRESI